MIAFAENKKQTGAGVVCPVCFKPVSRIALTGGFKDAYDRFIRRYFGWCLGCSFGFEVIQFHKEGTGWLINQYRLFKVWGENKIPQPTMKWRLVNELPAVPLVVTGPGGDFIESKDEEIIGAMDATLNALKSMTSAFEALKKYVMLKKND